MKNMIVVTAMMTVNKIFFKCVFFVEFRNKRN